MSVIKDLLIRTTHMDWLHMR